MKRLVMLLISFIAISFVVIYLTFFYYPKCNDVACWDSKLRVCSKAKYTNSPVDATWQYTILGKKNIDEKEKCEVKVLAVDIKRGLKNTEVLEGKEMTCYLPLGYVTSPEGNPNICTGNLKEEMQNLIIKKLHQYIIDNLGEISKEAGKIEGIENVNIVGEESTS